MTPAMLVLGLYSKNRLIMEVIGIFKIRERVLQGVGWLCAGLPVLSVCKNAKSRVDFLVAICSQRIAHGT